MLLRAGIRNHLPPSGLPLQCIQVSDSLFGSFYRCFYGRIEIGLMSFGGVKTPRVGGRAAPRVFASNVF